MTLFHKTLLLLAATACAFAARAQDAAGAARTLDTFDDASAWRVVMSNQVTAKVTSVDADGGKALCLDYDFNGVSGYAGIQRDLAIDYPDNYAFAFRIRGDSPANDLQMKFVDASGNDVWWINRPQYAFPKEWTDVRYKKRQIDKAWGPSPDRVLRHSEKLEFTIYNHAGGQGRVCFDALALQPLAPQDDSPLSGRASANVADGDAPLATDGSRQTAWWANVDARNAPQWRLDLGRRREFGGVILRWLPGAAASAYRIELSNDGEAWRLGREVAAGDGGSDYIALPESEARYLRLTALASQASSLDALRTQPRSMAKAAGSMPGKGAIALAEFAVQPLAFAATPNDFVKAVAAEAPRGAYPRGFVGEQPYWTIVGVDGGEEQGLIGEDGAIELGKGAISIEPQVIALGAPSSPIAITTWADADISQSLQDGYLPIPTVHWKRADYALDITAFAQGDRARSQLLARYRLTNTTGMEKTYTLLLKVRPFQVNPPSQFLNTIGGVSDIHQLSIDNDVVVNGRPRLRAFPQPTARGATTFDRQDAAGIKADRGTVANDPTGLASGSLMYTFRLAPGASYEASWIAPLSGAMPAPLQAGDADAMQRRVADVWRGKLDRVRIQVPAQGQALVDTLRTATAHMLISRIGPRLQPGTRSYSRSWIRDGAMISEGLLRMDREDVVRDYVAWYAPYQFENGMVPCCVDDRGSDPVPENDSHGELIFNIAELYRYTGDKAFLRTMWPHVSGAFGYMEKLRLRERTEANRAANPAFYGMMPASISHEGYSAKPMHSYWDDFWALRGYKDAVEIARWLGEDAAAARFAAARDEFRADLDASLRNAARQHAIDYLPGSAELGDFDPTSTTIALAPGGEQGRLPDDLLRNGFERYWREFEQRRDSTRAWKDYTPYEWRNVAAFVRLGWRERAWSAVDFFFGDRRPLAWNQWAEVVSRTPRTPFFVGDLPHAWVASDFVRSALDMFAYAREIDDSLVLAAGIPAAWFDGDGIAIHGLRTAQGTLGYTLRRHDGILALDIDDGLRLPRGGLVLPWPYADAPGAATVDGRAARWEGRELRIRALPAHVEIAMPAR